jgi:putative endonuclease
MSNKEIGIFGENMAISHLSELGYEIMHRNWRYKHLEIDIIANKDNLLHIIEVKTRTSIEFGYPEQFIGRQKFQFLKNAAAMYQYQNPKWKNIQFNVISILLTKPIEILFLEDVFF